MFTREDMKMLRAYHVLPDDAPPPARQAEPQALASDLAIEYARRLYAEQEAHALAVRERDAAAEEASQARADLAGLRLQCTVLWVVSVALFFALCYVAGGRW